MKLTRKLAAVAAALALSTTLAACGGDDDDASGSATTEAGAEATATEGVAVDGAWARTSPAAAENGAAYMTLTAAEDDALVSAAVDPAVAKMVQVHETVMADGDKTDMSMANGSSMSEAMTMKEVDKIALPKGEKVELKPGGYHIMLMELAKPLEKGSTIALTLTFEKAGELKVDVPVQDAAS